MVLFPSQRSTHLLKQTICGNLLQLLQSANTQLNAKTYKHSFLPQVSFFTGPMLPGVIALTEQRGCKKSQIKLQLIFIDSSPATMSIYVSKYNIIWGQVNHC